MYTSTHTCTTYKKKYITLILRSIYIYSRHKCLGYTTTLSKRYTRIYLAFFVVMPPLKYRVISICSTDTE